MEICIFYKYRVKRYGEYSYISDEDSLGPEDLAYHTDGYVDEVEMDGGELMELIVKKLKDMYIMNFSIYPEEHKMKFEYFNPNNGEGSTDEYLIEAIK